MSREPRLGSHLIVVRQMPALGAGALARLAADAHGAVVEDRFRHNRIRCPTPLYRSSQGKVWGIYAVRKNSLVTCLQLASGRLARRSSVGRPPSAATAPASCGCRAYSRPTASRIQLRTNPFGTRLRVVLSSSGTWTSASHPLPYGSFRRSSGLAA